MISVCMIMKNEEKYLEKTLKLISKYKCEIIIVDTGSTDKSVEIAKKYTDRVYFFKWINDFSIARNFSISKASNDVVLVLDCDEFIEEADFDEIEKVICNNPNKVGKILIKSPFCNNGMENVSNERVPRVFLKQVYKYTGIIHEQPTRIDGKEKGYIDVPLKVWHTGYDGDINIRTKKAERNIKLLIEDLKEKPKDEYILFQLGKSYYMKEDYENAVRYFKKCADLKPDLKFSYVHEMYETYAYALINTNRNSEALKLIDLYDELSITADFVFVAGLIYINCGKLSEAINEFNKALKMDNAKIEGVNSFAANYNIGVIYECVGDKKTAKNYYEKCGDYKPALDGLRRLK